MWKCPKCGRIFEKQGQVHSCRKKPLDEHFIHKDLAKTIFDSLVKEINQVIGTVEIISIPCCIHLFGKNDFLAALPKKDRLEIRFSMNRIIDSPRIRQSVPLSKSSYKICIDLYSTNEIDGKLIEWIKESYHLKDTE